MRNYHWVAKYHLAICWLDETYKPLSLHSKLWSARTSTWTSSILFFTHCSSDTLYTRTRPTSHDKQFYTSPWYLEKLLLRRRSTSGTWIDARPTSCEVNEGQRHFVDPVSPDQRVVCYYSVDIWYSMSSKHWTMGIMNKQWLTIPFNGPVEIHWSWSKAMGVTRQLLYTRTKMNGGVML